MYQKSKTIENVLILLLDIVCRSISILAAFLMRYQLWMGINKNWEQLQQIVIIIIISILLKIFVDFNHYFTRRGYFEEFVAVCKEQLVFSVIWILCLYLMHTSNVLSRLVFIL